MQSDKKEQALDALLGGFDDESPLNLTGGQQDEKEKLEGESPEMIAKMQKEYEAFMQEMMSGGMGEGDQGMSGLTDMLGGLLKGLADEVGEGKQGEDLKKMMQGEMKEGNLEDFAGKLLEMFMNKDLLYEPLQESKASYQKFFKNQSPSAPDLERYKSQYNLVCEILNVLDKDPNNKHKLMELFEKMQDFGPPPAGITSVSLPSGM